MTTFYFIRHGNIDRLGADFDPALTSLGITEAEATAQRLADVPADRIFASHLRRAQETAQIIGARHNLRIADDPRLRERANYGDPPGQTVDEFVAMWERCNVERTWMPPVGDSSRGCGARVEAFVADCFARWPKATIVAASHGGTIADFLLNVFTIDEIAAVSPTLAARPYNGEIMRECSVTEVTFDGGSYSLAQAASVEHLHLARRK